MTTKELTYWSYETTKQSLKFKLKSNSPTEFARRQENQKSGDVNVKEVFYIVPTPNDYLNAPNYKVNRRQPKPNELKPSLKDFVKFNPNGTLDRSDNRFVVSTKTTFKIY